MALDATVGTDTANSYVTEAEAEVYMDDRSYASAWSTFADKSKLLITSSSFIDWYLKFKGTKATSAQSMQWPRLGAVRPDGVYVDSTIIPREVKIAVCEMALSSLESDRTDEDPLAGISQLKVSSLSITAGPSKPNQTNRPVIPPKIHKILSDLLSSQSGAFFLRIDRA